MGRVVAAVAQRLVQVEVVIEVEVEVEATPRTKGGGGGIGRAEREKRGMVWYEQASYGYGGRVRAGITQFERTRRNDSSREPPHKEDKIRGRGEKRKGNAQMSCALFRALGVVVVRLPRLVVERWVELMDGGLGVDGNEERTSTWEATE